MSDVFDDLAKAFKVGHDTGRSEAKRNIEAREVLIRDLCRALERAQEIIIDLGEKSGSEELLNEARVYANAIGGMTEEFKPKPARHYADNPVIKKYREALKKAAEDEGRL